MCCLGDRGSGLRDRGAAQYLVVAGELVRRCRKVRDAVGESPACIEALYRACFLELVVDMVVATDRPVLRWGEAPWTGVGVSCP
jgi:hypothetical protein